MQEAIIAIDGVGCMAAGSSEAAEEITNLQGSPSTVTGTSSQARLLKLFYKVFWRDTRMARVLG